MAAKAVVCLAAMMHGEAGVDGDEGMLAVAQVAIHRNAADPCKAVQAPRQFQGYDPDYVPTKHELSLARRALKGEGPDLSGADHFIRIGSKAYWLKAFEVVATVGHHEFLREASIR